MLNVNDSAVYTDFDALAKLKTAAKENSPEAVKQVAKQFEALFLNMVLKGMRQAKLSDGLMDSDQSKFYQDMYDQQLAVNLAGNPGTGLADLVAKQLSPDQNRVQEKRDITDYLQNSLTAITTQLKPLQVLPKAAAEKPAFIEANGVRTFALDSIEEPVFQALPDTSKAVGAIKSRQHFVDKLLPLAKQAAAELGVDPRILVAQAALETGWGQSVIKTRDGNSSHNLFNIKAGKAWTGKQANVSTLEFEQGIAKKTMAGFRAYSSYQDSFNDYVKFLKENPRYSDALKAVSNPAGYIQELQQAGYATDPNYSGKVLTIYNGKHLAANAPEQLLAMQ